MFTIIGCLGASVGTVSTTREAVQLVLSQVPVSTKTQDKISTGLARLAVGHSYQVEYGGSGCTVTRLE